MDTCEVEMEFEVANEDKAGIGLSADSGKGHHNYKNIKLLFLIGSLFLAGAALWGVVRGIKQDLPLQASAMTSESGASYTTALPASSYWLLKSLTDNPASPYRSQTELFEDDKPLGPAHSPHEAIRKAGSGQFSHWSSTLYFSTSDNSNPQSNGRHYKAVTTAILPIWVLAVAAACLLLSLYLNRQMVSLRLAVEQSDLSAATSPKIRWRWGLLAALAMSLLSLYPQIDLWLTRGADWQGSYTSLNYDEEIYAAYINGLILGRPRRAKPLEIAKPGKPSYESFFSIQFVPAYLIAFFVRVSGLTVAQAFIALTPLIAFLTTLMIFYLLASATRHEALAAVGALTALICGTLACRQSAVNQFFGWNWCGNFLFLRRYQPAMAFPAFFGFIVLIWQAITGQGRRAWCAAIAAGAVFALLIFSYFFCWTSAIAWLACFALAWCVIHRAEWRLLVKRLAPTALFAAVAFPLYAVMLAHQNPALDQRSGAFDFTHAPDFYRAPELIAVVALLLLLWAVKKGLASWREPLVLLTSSLALMPLVVFNQQIITGRSLESIHYEGCSANYLSILALVLTLAIIWRARSLVMIILSRWRGFHFERRVSGWLIPLLTCVVIGWGVFEMRSITIVMKERNVARDLFAQVAKRLTALAAEHGTGSQNREFVFSPDILVVSENIATSAPQVPFWAYHMPTAGGLSWGEQQERFFQYLYYSGEHPDSLERRLKNNEMVAVGAIFGHDRYNPTLTNHFKPITTTEIEDKVRQYAEYAASFDCARARHPEISYVIVDTRSPSDFTNLDWWYKRDAGERIGPFTLYQVKLR